MRVSTTIWLGLLLVCVVVLAGIAWTQLNGPAEEKPVMWRIGTAEVQRLELRHRSGVKRQFTRTAEAYRGATGGVLTRWGSFEGTISHRYSRSETSEKRRGSKGLGNRADPFRLDQ